ncbi:hypothetical protein [Halorientalis regularis]|uniref:Dam-replacing family protein n=1 Tax=Halorientalis regularis TaxID=660518 RepID=A0A1G7QE30_9EURY|nr:hypothetical protein [Halorientalis regularis]SDF96783.1 Dam-replacing family protein [Halorientalis regularis]
MTWKDSVKRELDRYREEHDQKTFTLAEFYEFAEDRLAAEYPNNNTIQAKIRQTLQRLREGGEIKFVDDNGNYRFPEPTPTIPDFRLNHPKNYFGYTLAVDIATMNPARAVASLMTEQNKDGKKITSDISGARAGAHHLDLVETTGETTHLTNLGHRLVSFAEREHDSTDAALNELRSFFGTSKLFVDALPAWTGLTREIMVNDQGIARLVELMFDIHSSRDEG